ncbi:hypothetical protein F4825DRAFT_462315 [Nemania diffusa]|nr:hypothetical protein F4825DRAFT_462315 [Nemania diffusa]
MQNSTVGWQAGPTERGTLSLVYSCLITIFACTWTVLHLNVPKVDDGLWKLAFRKAKWMAITILFPEFIFSKAICDLRQALYDLREFDIIQARGQQEHAGETEMSRLRGGATEGEDNNLSGRSSSSQEEIPRVHKPQHWTITHAHLANMGGKYALTGSFLGSHYTWDNAHPLHGLILDEEDINDKSKVDSLLRALTVLQALWVILTAIVRGANGLPVSQLEIATSAFSLSAAATYAASWWKPKDVSRPLQLQEPTDWPLITPDSTYIIVQRFVLRLTSLFVAHHARFVTPPLRIPNDFVRMEGNIPLIFTLMACSSFVFGGIHLIAWNFEFPSYPELILWRVSSLTSSILPLITLGLNIYLNYRLTTHPTKHLIPWLSENLEPLEALRGPFWESVCEFLVLGTGIIYVASRLIILVLLFTSLRSAPKGIYDNTPWTRFLPNIS